MICLCAVGNIIVSPFRWGRRWEAGKEAAVLRFGTHQHGLPQARRAWRCCAMGLGDMGLPVCTLWVPGRMCCLLSKHLAP